MSTVDDVWASMQEETNSVKREYGKRSKFLQDRVGNDIINSLNKSTKPKASSKKINQMESSVSSRIRSDIIVHAHAKMPPNFVSVPAEELNSNQIITAQTMLSKISRDLNISSDKSSEGRKSALKRLQSTLFEEYSMAGMNKNTS